MAVSSKLKTGIRLSVAFGFTLALGIGGYAFTARSTDRYLNLADTAQSAFLKQLGEVTRRTQASLKRSENSTLAFLATQDYTRLNAKKRDDAEIGAALTQLTSLLEGVPDNGPLLALLNDPVKQSLTVCSLLDPEVLSLGGRKDAAATASFLAERYLPLRAELETRFNDFARTLEIRQESESAKAALASASLRRSLQLGWALQAGMIALAGLAVLGLLAGLSSRFTELISAVRGLANGDPTRPLLQKQTGELGELQEAVQAAALYQIETSRVVRAMSEGDLTQIIVPKSRKDTLNIALAKLAGNLQETLLAIHTKIETLEAQTSQTPNTDWDLTTLHSFRSEGESPLEKARTLALQLETLLQKREAASPDGHAPLAQAAGLISGTALSAEQTVQGVSELASQSQSTAHLASQNHLTFRRTASEIVTLQSEMSSASDTLLSLGKRSQETLAVIEALQETADRTDTLALNAAIEAARAGSEGAEFGAIAEQMRGLAERSSQTAQQVYLWMQQVQQETRSAFEITQRGAASLEETLVSASGSAEALHTVTENLHTLLQTAGTSVDSAIRTQLSASTASELTQTAQRNALSDEEALGVVAQAVHELNLLFNDLTSQTGLVLTDANHLERLEQREAGQSERAEDLQRVTEKLRERLSFFKVEMPENAAVTSLLSTERTGSTIAA